MNWEKIMTLQPESLSQHEKENLYESVAWCNPDCTSSKKYLLHFIRIIQEVLKFKSDQLDCLTNELDEIAKKQGTEESNKLQQLRDEIERLQKEIDWYRKSDKSNNKLIDSNSSNQPEIRLLKLQNQNDELLNELNEKKKELALEKKEVEKYASLIAKMEREKQEINRELKALKEEEVEKSFRSLKNSPESEEEKFEALMDTIENKNKHISVLLRDIENIEEENSILKINISAIKVELKETTSHISDITEELSKFKQISMEYENKEADLKEKINSLMCQIEELIEDKKKRDMQLDEYVTEFNTNVSEWKKVIESKDEEIFKLKEELKGFYYNTNTTFPIVDNGSGNLNEIIKQQHEQIFILQKELQKATEEINISTEIIEQLKKSKNKQIKSITLPKPACNKIQFLKEKIKVLEEKLKYAEDDAHLKAKESSVLIAQLREYESKVFGLSEAMAKIKKLENDVQKKDLRSEKLVDVCNDLELKINCLEEQNLILREKLGLSSADQIDTSGIVLKFKKNEELICILKEEVQKKEEELIQIKLMYRKIASQIEELHCHGNNAYCFNKVKSPTIVDNPNNENKENLDLKMNFILEENDALRKGMHEILESIRSQNCFGNILVQSNCLERLLEAMDSRHISGWYHPAMRLQAQLNAEEGKNDELRNQIRYLKAESKKKSSELKNAHLKIKSLENDVAMAHNFERNQAESAVVENFEKPLFEGKKWFSVNTVQEKKVIEAESELCKLKVLYDQKLVEIEKKEKSFSDVKEELLSVVEGLRSQIDVLKNENPEMINLMELTEQNVVLGRKVNYLKSSEYEYVKSLENLKREFLDEEEKMLLVILKLQNEKSNLVHELEELENGMINLVSVEKFTSVKKELASITAKYKRAISLSLLSEETKNNELTKVEIELLKSEKYQLEEELRQVKEKLVISEALIKEETVTKGDFVNEISSLANRLATSEAKELNEKQRALHLDKINDVLKSQLKELEDRNKDLLEKVMKLTEDNFKYQEVERQLRGQDWKRFLEEESHVFEDKIKILEKKIKELTMEKDNIQELLEISQGQCRSFQEWKNEDKILLATQKEEILLLQSSSEVKASLSRLSHELAISKLTSSELIKKNKDLKMKVAKLLTQNLSLENRVSEYRRECLTSKKKHLNQIEFLHETINRVRNLYGCPVSFSTMEIFHNKKMELKESAKKAAENANELRIHCQEYILKKSELETELKCLDEMKNALKGHAKSLVVWHDNSSALRLKEAKYKRQNELLLSEVSQLKNCVDRLNEEIYKLEEENLEKERYWEQKELLWEENQRYVCQLIRENGLEKNCSLIRIKDLSDATTNTVSNVSKEQGNTTDKEEELEVEGNESREEWSEIEEKEEGLKEVEKEIILTKPELNFYENDAEGTEKEALKMTIDSLESIIKQKEETIVKYQDLLKKERDECETSCSKLEKEIKALNDAFNVQSKAYNKLKNASNGSSLSVDNVSKVVETYITTIQELEEEVRVYQLNLSSINTQLHLSQQEVEKWHTLAVERLSQMEDMKRRMNEECKNELDNYKRDIRNYESEVERLVKLMETQRNDFNTESPNERKENTQQEKKELEEKNISNKTTQEYKKQTMKEIESLKKQLKLAKNESTRLRERIQVLESRPRKRLKTATPSLSRCNSNAFTEKTSFTIKIKKLEESLMASREKEKEFIEFSEKKLKSAEEVARWEERKKNEQLVKNLNIKLREKEAEVEVLTNKNVNFRTLVQKFEKDKEILNSQFKVLKENSTELNAVIQKLRIEKKSLQDEINVLKVHLKEEKRHSSNVGTSLLHEKLEAQERKLMAYELASKDGNSIAKDFEKLQILNSKLEKLNLKLESENLSLRLKFEKEKIGGKHLKENNGFGRFEKCFCLAKDKGKEINSNGITEENQKDVKIFLEKSLENKKKF